MRKSILAVLSVFLLGFMCNPALAQFGQPPMEAKEISAADAAKNYPPPKGGYPTGEITAGAGFVKSPYSPFRMFNTHGYGKDGKPTTIKRGALILDPGVKQVFVNP